MIGPIEAVCRTILAALAAGIAEAALLGTFVAVLIATSRASATTRHVLWWLALAGAALLPFASVAGSLARVEHRAPARASVPDDARRTARTGLERRTRASSETARTSPAIAVARSVAAYPHAAEIGVAIWLGLAAAGFGSLARGLVALRRIKRDASPLDEALVRRLRRFRHSSRAGRAVDVRVSNAIDVPVAVGFRTPTILLPVRFVEDEHLAGIADLDAIAMHEYAHLDRYDDWTNLAERALATIFWFDPIVRFFVRRIALEREIACDDWAIAQTGRARTYAATLWKFVEATHLPTRPIVAPGALFDARQIGIRIERLLDSRRNAIPRLAPLGAVATTLVAIALVVAQTVRAPAIAIDATIAARDPVVVAIAPRATASPVPAPAAPHAPIRLHRVPVEATPDAIARAVATAVGAASHAVVETTVTRRAIGAGAYADEIGIDVAKAMANGIATGLASPSHAGIGNACVGCDLEKANLRDRDLRGVAWTGVDLENADLRGADLRGARLVGVELAGARLDGADLRGAKIFGCSVTRAQLASADTRGAQVGGIGD